MASFNKGMCPKDLDKKSRKSSKANQKSPVFDLKSYNRKNFASLFTPNKDNQAAGTSGTTTGPSKQPETEIELTPPTDFNKVFN